MFRFTRACGYAAVGLTLAGSVAFADPLMALDVETVPAAPRFTDHAFAQIDGAVPPSQTLFSSPTVPTAVTAPAGVAAETEEVEKEEPRSLRQLAAQYADDEAADAEQECLAQAVYFESKGEPLEGQLAVAEVVINRAESGRFPSTLCGVVRQKSQFSFVRGGRIPTAPKASAAWRTAVAIAYVARNELAESAGARAMFFHANYVRPGWRGLTRVAAVGNHIFYR